MELINLTPHEIRIHNDDGALVLSVPPSGQVARVNVSRELDTEAACRLGVPAYITAYGEVTGLPEMQPDTIYIVSGMVRAALPARADLWQPGELLRDDAGRVVGCIGLSQ